MKSSYNSTLGELDIAGNSNDAKEGINSWVANVTHNKIKDLLKEIKSDSKMVLISASYFKAAWVNRLGNGCNLEPFYVAGGMVVYTMFTSFWCISEASYAAFPEFKATAIGIPYAGYPFRMIIVLPNERNGICDLRNLLNSTVFDVSRYRTDVNIHLSLPMVNVEADYQVSKVLQTLGIKKAFLNTANFTGIADSPDPEDWRSISQVIYV